MVISKPSLSYETQMHVFFREKLFNRASNKCVNSTYNGTIIVIFSSHSMFAHLWDSPQRDNSYKWSNIGLNEEIGFLELKICSYLDLWFNVCGKWFPYKML